MPDQTSTGETRYSGIAAAFDRAASHVGLGCVCCGKPHGRVRESTGEPIEGAICGPCLQAFDVIRPRPHPNHGFAVIPR